MSLQNFERLFRAIDADHDLLQANINEVRSLIVDAPPPPTVVNGSIVFEQETPLASWTFEHGLGRVPATALVVDGEPFSTQIQVTATHVYVTWPSPTVGFLILS